REGREFQEYGKLDGVFSVPYKTRQAATPLGAVGTGSLTDPVSIDQSQGDVRETGNELDLALVGNGYFEMQSPDGNRFYTRSGQFERDGVGRLVDSKGNFVMGDNGVIRVRQGPVTV